MVWTNRVPGDNGLHYNITLNEFKLIEIEFTIHDCLSDVCQTDTNENKSAEIWIGHALHTKRG